MEEEKKTNAGNGEKEESKVCMPTKTLGKILIGIIIVVLGLWAVIGWWPDLLVVIKGCVGLFLIMIGAITIAIAKD